ncbi:MAG: hypothetical protein WBD71_01065 [Xanthobacteraceae bacterium]
MWFIAAVVWGSLSAQFLVQVVSSLITGFVYLSGLLFSRVSKSITAIGTLVGFIQAVVFAALFFGGNWFASSYIDYGSWNADSIASVVAFLLTIIYCALQVPGKILVARLCAWKPYFAQTVRTRRPGEEAVAFAREYLKDLQIEKAAVKSPRSES